MQSRVHETYRAVLPMVSCVDAHGNQASSTLGVSGGGFSEREAPAVSLAASKAEDTAMSGTAWGCSATRD